MKRLLIVVALLAALAPAASASASTRTPLSSQLLSGKNLSKQWSRYYIENQDTATCPESNFGRPASKSSLRVLFANTNSGTLILEKLTSSDSAAKVYDILVERTLKCPKSTSTSKFVTYQRVRSIQMPGISSPHHAFYLAADAGGASVTGSVVYAVKGNVVVGFAELSIVPFNARQFKTTLEKALAKVTS